MTDGDVTDLAEANALIRSLREELAATNDGTLALHAELDDKVRELGVLSQELRSFAYSVSHDLRQPLRAIAGFSEVVSARYASVLDDRGRHYLTRIVHNVQRMEAMIEGLLRLSRVTRHELDPSDVALDAIAEEVVAQLQAREPHREVEVSIEPGMLVHADADLMESVVQNLLSNAWKYSAAESTGRIRFERREIDGQRVHVVEDDGVGFDMRHADRLFGVFQRLHDQHEYEGTGVGLATTQRVIHRHGGRIWARSEPGSGATFFFTLPPPRGDE